MFVIVAATEIEIKEIALRDERSGKNGADAVFERLVKSHAGTDGTYVELRKAWPSVHDASVVLRSSIQEEEAGDRLPFDVEDEDGEWHRVLAPTMQVAERQARRRGIRVSCVQEAEEGAGAEGAA